MDRDLQAGFILLVHWTLRTIPVSSTHLRLGAKARPPVFSAYLRLGAKAHPPLSSPHLRLRPATGSRGPVL